MQPPGPVAVQRPLPSWNGGADAAPQRAARAAQIPIEPDPGGPADQILLGHVTPVAPVVAVVAVIAHHQIMPRRHVADKRGHLAAAGRVLVPADVAAHAAPVAPRQPRLAIERHRAEYRLVLVPAEALHRERQLHVAAVVVLAGRDPPLQRLAGDRDAIGRHLDVVAGRAYL